MKIGFFGGGNMAEGILSAIEDKKNVIIAEKNPERAKALAKKYGVAVTGDVKEVAAKSDVVFLAVRPQDVDSVAVEVKSLLYAKQTLVSIVAGKTLAKLRTAFGRKVGMIRVMPNLALRVGAGMCAICPASRTSKAHLSAVQSILGGVERHAVLFEKLAYLG